MTIKLFDFADLAALMGLAEEDVADYPDLGVIITSVTAAIENYLGRALEQVERTETVFVNMQYRQMIGLVALPVVTVSEVLDDGTDITSEISVTHYGIRLASPVQHTALSVTYTGGIASDAVPADIARAALMQAAYEFQGKDQIGASMVSTEGGTVSRPALQLLAEVKRLLNPHKHPLKIN